MDVLEKSWHLSPQGVNIITENNTIKDRTRILRNALNADLKEVGSPVLTNKDAKTTLSDVVLQIQKIRNISAPKANENSQAAPRMLKLVLTDGDSYIQAIEISLIPSINRDKTPPGTKIMIKSAKVASNFLLLDAQNCSILGGEVPALCEKWELAKSVSYNQNNRENNNSSSDGPPAWVNFGSRIVSDDQQNKQFKSIENKEGKENSEFDLQRQGAIAEATTGAVKKVFGGGAKQTVQPVANTRNYQNANRDKKFKNVKQQDMNDAGEKIEKPSERVSLFDFLENKLPAGGANPENGVTSAKLNPNNAFTNYQSYNPSKSESTYRNNQFKQVPPKPEDRNTYRNNQGGNSYNNYQPNRGGFQEDRTHQYYQQNYRQSRPPPTQKNDNYKPKYENRVNSAPQPQTQVDNLGNNFSKMSVSNSNSQFATRSLRQHLNLTPQKKNDFGGPSSNVAWKVGDECMAKYWEDRKFYRAIITAVTDTTCVVKFKGYDNIEEILKTDCFQASKDEGTSRPHTGPVEFRRSSRPYKNQ